MKNMKKVNVVVLSVGEQQYPQDYLDKITFVNENFSGLDKVIKEYIKNTSKKDFLLKFLPYHNL